MAEDVGQREEELRLALGSVGVGRIHGRRNYHTGPDPKTAIFAPTDLLRR